MDGWTTWSEKKKQIHCTDLCAALWCMGCRDGAFETNSHIWLDRSLPCEHGPCCRAVLLLCCVLLLPTFLFSALELKFEFCHFLYHKWQRKHASCTEGLPKHKGAHCDLICKRNFERTPATASYPGRATQSTIRFCCLSRQASPTGVEYGETRPEWYITDTDPTTR